MIRQLYLWSAIAATSAMLVMAPSSSAAQETQAYPEHLQSYVDLLGSQLRAYVVAQEVYIADHVTYGGLDLRGDSLGINFPLSPGVRLLAQFRFSTHGHFMILSHEEALELTCAVYVGEIGVQGKPALEKVLGGDGTEGQPECRIFETIRVCTEGDASPSLLNWNFCSRHGHRMRDSVPNQEPVQWDRGQEEWDRADIATLTLGAGSLEVSAFHNKRMPDSLPLMANNVSVRATRGDSTMHVMMPAHEVPALLDAMTQRSTALAIADDVNPTTLTLQFAPAGNTVAVSCQGGSGCQPVGFYVLTLDLTLQDVRDLIAALERAYSAFEESGGSVPSSAAVTGTLRARVAKD